MKGLLLVAVLLLLSTTTALADVAVPNYLLNPGRQSMVPGGCNETVCVYVLETRRGSKTGWIAYVSGDSVSYAIYERGTFKGAVITDTQLSHLHYYGPDNADLGDYRIDWTNDGQVVRASAASSRKSPRLTGKALFKWGSDHRGTRTRRGRTALIVRG